MPGRRPSLFHGFRSISRRARHDSTGFPCPSSPLVDLKPRLLSRRSMRSTYGKENPVKTFPLVPQLDLRANQRDVFGGRRPTLRQTDLTLAAIAEKRLSASMRMQTRQAFRPKTAFSRTHLHSDHCLKPLFRNCGRPVFVPAVHLCDDIVLVFRNLVFERCTLKCTSPSLSPCLPVTYHQRGALFRDNFRRPKADGGGPGVFPRQPLGAAAERRG